MKNNNNTKRILQEIRFVWMWRKGHFFISFIIKAKGIKTYTIVHVACNTEGEFLTPSCEITSTVTEYTLIGTCMRPPAAS